MIELKDEDLVLRLKNFEDNFVERKTSGDSRDWLKTVVAFANSTPVGYPAVLFIGVKDDGTPEEKPVNLDSLQKSFVEKVRDHYPPIYYVMKVIEIGGRQFLAVVIPGSPDRPHFAGPAFVRKGSKTEEASHEQFANLIAMRNSKAYEILKWKGKEISVQNMDIHQRTQGTIVDCNHFYCTIQSPNSLYSVPLRRLDIGFDNPKKCLKLEVRPS